MLPVFRMDELEPVLHVIANFAGAVTQDPLDSVAGGDAGFGIDFVDHAAHLARRRAETLVAGRKRGLTNLARSDVHHEAEHTPGAAVGRAIDHHCTVERPVPAAVGVPESVLGL